MITNAPTSIFARSQLDRVGDRPHAFLAWLLGKVQQSLCALHGHDAILQYERNRIYLRCTSCAYESPGWEVAHNSTLRHRPVDARPALSPAGDLTVARKIA